MFSITQLPSVETFSYLSHPQQLHFVYGNCRNFSIEETIILKYSSLKSLTQESRKDCAIKTFHVNPIKIVSPTAKNLNNN